MAKFYFTFGIKPLNKNIRSLSSCFVEVVAETETQARDMMFATRGGKLAFSYLEEHKHKAIFDLVPRTLEQVTIDTEDGESHHTQ